MAVKCPKRLPIRLSVNDKKFVIGTLTREDPEIVLKLKIAQQFKLYHECKGLDVYVRGHSAKMVVPILDDYHVSFLNVISSMLEI